MSSNEIKPSSRMSKLPPYTFAEIERKKNAVVESGVDLINFGIGDPDLPPPQQIKDALVENLEVAQYHRYPIGSGAKELKEEIAVWFKNRFQVELDSDEILVLIGSKEGIAHLPFAMVDSGEVVLIPDPGYCVYYNATLLAGGIPIELPLSAEENFLFNPFKVDPKVLKNTKMMFINYPNNPTAALAPLSYYEKLVDFARENQILICSDNAYSELYYDDDKKPHSIFEVPGAKDVAVEFHSFSKTFNMTGWRLGFVVGNKKVVQTLGTFKENMDSGAFMAIQQAGVAGLRISEEQLAQNRNVFKERRDLLMKGLRKLGFKVMDCDATFYLWVRTLNKMSSTEFVEFLLEKYGVLTIPGSGLGKFGEGYVRFAFTISKERIEEALLRMNNIADEVLTYCQELKVD